MYFSHIESLIRPTEKVSPLSSRSVKRPLMCDIIL